MEHLLLPRGTTVSQSEKAPYLAEPYDCGAFLEFPGRSRFNALFEFILPPHAHPARELTLNPDETAATEIFCQTWLIFGLLNEVFGSSISRENFITTEEDGTRYFTTTSLSNVVDDWISANHVDAGDTGSADRLDHFITCVMLAHRFLMAIRNVPTISPPIIWSTASVCETIESVVLETLQKGTRSLPTTWQACYRSEAQEQMAKCGWCPTDIARWSSRLDGFQSLYYLSKLQQPIPRDHTVCSGAACTARNQTNSNDASMHRCQKGDCGMLSVDLESLKSILDDGAIGLLDIQGEQDLQTMTVGVVSSKANTGYVAFSHVWADGLGNPNGNTLPRCQLSYVGTIVKQLRKACASPHLLLWLDTLCCPVASLSHRRKCLVLMRQIYTEADHVLVLDAQLNAFEKSELDSIEICARLMFSRWTRRLWTLQEGALPRRLWVQLGDGAVDLGPVQADAERLYQTQFMHSPLLLELVAGLKTIRSFGSHGTVPSIVRVKQALANRSVTVAADEALCLCTCMNLDQSFVANVDEDERMGAFWMALGAAGYILPKSIIFSTGPKLHSNGLHWAPFSFLGSNVFPALRSPKDHDETASINQDGLFATFPAFECTFSRSLSSEEGSIIQDALQDVAHLRFVRCGPEDWLMVIPEEPLQASTNTVLTIILGTSLDRLDGNCPGQEVSLGLAGVSDQSEDGENRTFHTIMSANVIRVKPELASTLDLAQFWGGRLDLFDGSLKHRERVEESLAAATSEYLQKLPSAVVSSLLQVAREAFEKDITLFSKLTRQMKQQQSSQLFNGALNAFAEYLLFYLAGRFGELVRVWPEDQKWCLD